jgi:hypothetical protein
MADEAAAHHVAHDQGHGAAGQRDRVEPVAPGRLLLPGHQVAGRDLGLRQHRQRGGQQGLLQFGHGGAGRGVAQFGLGRLRAGRLPLGHLLGDVGADHQQAVDGAVGGSPRHRGEVGVDLLPAAGTVELRPPLAAGLRIPGSVHPVKQLVHLLALDLGKHLAVGHPDHVVTAGEGPVGRIDRGYPVVRAVERGHHDRHLLEGVLYHSGIPHEPGEGSVVHSVVTRRPLLRPIRQCGLLVVHPRPDQLPR